MSDSEEMLNNKRTNKIYVSPRFTNKDPETGEIRFTRKVSKVFDVKNYHFFEYLKKEKHVVLRVTKQEKHEVIASIIEGEDGFALSIQRFTKKTGIPNEMSFSFWGGALEKLMNFLYSLKEIDFSNPSNFQLLDSALHTKMGSEDLKNISDELKKREIPFSEFSDFATKFLNSKQDLTLGDLQSMRELISFKEIENALKFWEDNKENSKEVEVWQPFLKQNFWLISQLFSIPIGLFDDEFYLGGVKQGSLKGGKNVDYLGQNSFSKNVVLVEIKTPKTNLISKKEYGSRHGIYPVHRDLSGSISQVLNQKHILQRDFIKNENYEVWNPRVLLIIGSEEHEEFGEERRSCFELFRNNQKDVEIITFTELFQKAKILLNLLKK